MGRRLGFGSDNEHGAEFTAMMYSVPAKSSDVMTPFARASTFCAPTTFAAAFAAIAVSCS